MNEIEVLLALLGAIAVLARIARAIAIPDPILFLVGGVAIGFVPGLPEISLPPELVFVIFLPPLLYGAAFLASPRELRADAVPISLLAIGLVLVTMAVVATLVHWLVPGFSWTTAFVLGAILAPTDPVAAIAIFVGSGCRDGCGRWSRARASPTTGPAS